MVLSPKIKLSLSIVENISTISKIPAKTRAHFLFRNIAIILTKYRVEPSAVVIPPGVSKRENADNKGSK